MKAIIQLSSKNNLVSRITKFITRGEFAHVDIIVPNFPYHYIGAHLLGGIQTTRISATRFHATKRYEVEVSNENAKWALEQVGRKYDIKAILGFLFKIPFRENRDLMCSAFVFDFLEQTPDFKHHIDFKSNKISPRDLHLILQIMEATGHAKKI